MHQTVCVTHPPPETIHMLMMAIRDRPVKKVVKVK